MEAEAKIRERIAILAHEAIEIKFKIKIHNEDEVRMNIIIEVRDLKRIAGEAKRSRNKKVAISQITQQDPIIKEN